MSTPTKPRRGRPPRVTRDAILDAVDTGGDTFTMAGLAQQLGVSEPAIYYHFPSKEALLVELGARILSELRLPDRALGWEPWLERFTYELLDVYQRHRALHDVDMSLIIASQPAVVRLVDQVLQHLVDHGFPLQLAAVAVQTVLAVAQPYAKATDQQDQEALHSAQATLRDIALVADAPLAAALYDQTPTYDSGAMLQQQLRIVLAGIRSELTRSAHGSRTQRRTHA